MWRVRRPSADPSQSGPPFNALAARRLRAALNMGPEHVAHGIRVSYGLPYVTPDHVVAWERGTVSPEGPELTALAGVLWCSPGELIGRPQSLREHRVARGLAPEDVARAVGLGLPAYQRMEEADDWRGTDRQSAQLADVLGLSLPDFVTVTGREEKLAELLTSAVTTRWQGCVRPIGKLAAGPAGPGERPPGTAPGLPGAHGRHPQLGRRRGRLQRRGPGLPRPDRGPLLDGGATAPVSSP